MNETKKELNEVVARIREMRDIAGYSAEQMAAKTDISVDEYLLFESGEVDIPFTFIHKCALAFDLEIGDLLSGQSAHLSSYNVTRKGKGSITAKEEGIEIKNLAPLFRSKIAEPYYVKYEYKPAQQAAPIHLTTHSGQEFDYVMEGSLKVQVGDHVEILNEGDSIYYNSSTPHGMIAVNGKDCLFLAFVLPGEEQKETEVGKTIVSAAKIKPLEIEKFIKCTEDETGALKAIDFVNEEKFNFAYDVVDALAAKYPKKRAMVHLDNQKNEREFTFEDMKKASARAANYFTSLGIKKGDRVMLVLKRHVEFWYSILALHKIGAVAIPTTNQMQQYDFEYRFKAGHVNAIVCTADGDTKAQVEGAEKATGMNLIKILVGESREGWHDFRKEFTAYSSRFERNESSPCGSDPMIMFFTSGTSGYPKIAVHNYKYPLAHFITARYWHNAIQDGLHFTISDTGWGKALWGKLYGQWMCECGVFVYDFDRFNSKEILPLFKQYNITTFCAPPTMYRMFIKEDLNNYDLSSIKNATIAGEALQPEVFYQFEKATGLKLMEGFGQTETTLTIGNLIGTTPKPGSMGKAVPLFDINILTPDGTPAGIGETGEIVIKTSEKIPCGLFNGYYERQDVTDEVWHDGYYHTGDVAWRDEDGYFWYVGRADDVIKSSGYRIGPFEIESVIMELPYVLECGVSAAPDEVRGQVVKASIVLTKGTEPTEELKKEVQNYVKSRTAPYKYPRIVVFRESLPKTISGKIQRNLL